MTDNKTYYITSPIYYVNDAPHIGHAYTTVACDALARFMRLDGRRVMFATGTDEHGQKVERSAAQAGIEPQEFCDRVSANFREMNSLMNISNDQFIRTTEPRHIRACQHLWQQLQERGEIYLGKFAGWYSVRDETFYDEKELIGGRAPTGADVEWVEEENYFFRLSAWQDRLLEYYELHPDFVAPPARRNEILSFVKGGLRDLSISRTALKWGVPIPGAPAHVMYVWLDALTNYLAAVDYPNVDSSRFIVCWPPDLHMVGKDIIRFHCVYWPAFLMAAGLPVPKRVFAHGWWTVEGRKMSKSLGNIITPRALVEQYGLDAVRYFMLRELPFGSDGDFSHSAIVGRTNSDLANGLGNLAQRVLLLLARECGGRVPVANELTDTDKLMLASTQALLEVVRTQFAAQAFHRALEQIWSTVGEANRYIDSEAPWELAKTDRTRLATVLYVAIEVIRHISILLQPIMPNGSSRLLDQLGIESAKRTFRTLSNPLATGVILPAPTGVFPRYRE